jgi:hypothetical protein
MSPLAKPASKAASVRVQHQAMEPIREINAAAWQSPISAWSAIGSWRSAADIVRRVYPVSFTRSPLG